MPETKPDPTKDPEFQKMVQTFLHTKPTPHKQPRKCGAAKPKAKVRRAPKDH
jgi:hypothetical protein